MSDPVSPAGTRGLPHWLRPILLYVIVILLIFSVFAPIVGVAIARDTALIVVLISCLAAIASGASVIFFGSGHVFRTPTRLSPGYFAATTIDAMAMALLFGVLLWSLALPLGYVKPQASPGLAEFAASAAAIILSGLFGVRRWVNRFSFHNGVVTNRNHQQVYDHMWNEPSNVIESGLSVMAGFLLFMIAVGGYSLVAFMQALLFVLYVFGGAAAGSVFLTIAVFRLFDSYPDPSLDSGASVP